MTTRPGPALLVPGVVRALVAATPRIRVLVLTMLVFNAGFYLVLPFLAAYLTGSLGLASAVVGAVLGLRMVCQQGLFVVGGAVADRWGVRRTVLAGVALRVVSFGLLAASTDLRVVIAAVVLLGVAGALFTPGIESLVAQEADRLERADGPSRTEVFALYSAAGQVGTLVGPAVGVLLLLGGFRWCCLVAALVFAAAYAVLVRTLPLDVAAADRERPHWRQVLGNRRFLLFAAGFSGYLAVYNQLYLAVPLELMRGGRSASLAAWLFTGSALAVVLLQVAVSFRVGPWLGVHRAVPLGFLLLTAGAGVPALLGPESATAGVLGFVVLLTLGQMLLLPAGRDAVARLAGERALATHFGIVGSAGGVMVLGLSAGVGWAFDAAALDRAPTALPWLLVCSVAALSALVTRRALDPARRTWPVRELTPSPPPRVVDPLTMKGQP